MITYRIAKLSYHLHDLDGENMLDTDETELVSVAIHSSIIKTPLERAMVYIATKHYGEGKVITNVKLEYIPEI